MNNVTVNSARNFIPKKLYGMKKRSIKNKMKKKIKLKLRRY